MFKWLIVYILIVNIYGLYVVWSDKRRARKGEWRIPEKQIWITSLIGGSIGVYITMKKIRHKTQHTSFMIGIPFIIILQIIVVVTVCTIK